MSLKVWRGSAKDTFLGKQGQQTLGDRQNAHWVSSAPRAHNHISRANQPVCKVHFGVTGCLNCVRLVFAQKQ